jgi:pilus assembly protein Flp/PilA
MVEKMKELLYDEEGATMVEYALMLALIAVVAITAVQLIGTNVTAKFNAAGNALGSTPTP